MTLDPIDDGNFNCSVRDDCHNCVDRNEGGLIINIDERNNVPDSFSWRFKFNTPQQIEQYKLDFEEATSTKWNSTGRVYKSKHVEYYRNFCLEV